MDRLNEDLDSFADDLCNLLNEYSGKLKVVNGVLVLECKTDDGVKSFSTEKASIDTDELYKLTNHYKDLR